MHSNLESEEATDRGGITTMLPQVLLRDARSAAPHIRDLGITVMCIVATLPPCLQLDTDSTETCQLARDLTA